MKRLIRGAEAIFSMANDRSTIKVQLQGTASTIITHILAIMCAEDEGNSYQLTIPHWYREIQTKFKRIPMLRIGKRVRNVTAKELYDWTWLVWEDGITDKKASLSMKNFTNQDHEGLYYGQDINIDRMKKIGEEYFKFACQNIAENEGELDNAEGVNYIKNLFEVKFPK